MTDEVSRLALAVDSTQVKTAQTALEGFADAGKKAEGAASAMEKAAKGAGGGLGAAAAAGAAAGRGLGAAGAAAKGAGAGVGALGAESKLTAQQMAQLSFQLNDFFVQVASGGSPLLALIQQGSQLNGTFGGLRGTLSALGTLFTTTRVIVGGLAGALGILAFGFFRGNEQSAEFARNIALTGNAAQLTEERYNSLARTIATATNTSIGSTRETLSGLVASGRFTGEALSQAGTAAQLLAKATGRSSEDILRDFTRAADGVAKFAEDINKQYNFLSAAQLRSIRDAEEQGRVQDALVQVFTALNGRLEAAVTNLGYLERAWGAVKRQVSEAGEAILSIGRDSTAEDRLREINRALGELDRAGQKDFLLFGDANALRAEKAALEETIRLRDRSAAQAAEKVQRDQAGIAFDKLREQSLSKQEQLTKALAQANALADKSGASAAEREKVLAAIRERYRDKSGDGGAAARRAQLNADVEDIRGALQREVAAYRGADAILESIRSAGLASEKDYYGAKLALIDAQAAAQIRSLETENARLAAERATGKDRIDLDRQIARNVADIDRIRTEASTRAQVLTNQEIAANDALIRSMTEVKIEAELYLESLKRANSLELSTIGLSDRERTRARDLAAIEENYRRRKEQLDAEFANGRLRGRSEQYERELQILEESQAEELRIYREGFDAISRAQGDWRLGASRALGQYSEDVRNAASQAELFLSSTFSKAEDALLEFVTKGKTDFKGLVDSIVADLLRIAIQQQILAPLADWMRGGTGGASSSFIGALFGGSRATGGNVTRGSMYSINERGAPGEILNVGNRQWLLAANDGTIRANAGRGGASFSNTNNFYLPPGGADRRTQQQIANAAAGSIARAARRGFAT